MIVIRDPSSIDIGLGLWLRKLFGFTVAEADLAVRLLHGQTLAEASEIRGVMISTVRSQLKGLMAKVGVRRQGELLTMLSKTPGVR